VCVGPKIGPKTASCYRANVLGSSLITARARKVNPAPAKRDLRGVLIRVNATGLKALRQLALDQDNAASTRNRGVQRSAPQAWFQTGGRESLGRLAGRCRPPGALRARRAFASTMKRGIKPRCDYAHASLQRALNKDEAGRRITDPIAGPLFSDQHTEGDQQPARSICCEASLIIR
jgi:hypothetical protein